MSKLFINIDHVATLREARKTTQPSPIMAMVECEKAGADGITVHLREDQRHIKEQDVFDIKENKTLPMNLESSLDNKIIESVCRVKPEITCIVPERRQEITTEGGLDVFNNEKKLKQIIKQYHEENIQVSIFVDPSKEAIDLSKYLGSDYIEIHTGRYANADDMSKEKELEIINNMIEYTKELGIKVNLGHGLDYQNILPFCKNKAISEFNIGHSIISRSIFVGLQEAVREMKNLIDS